MNSEMAYYAIAIAMFSDWLKNLPPAFQPMTGKTKSLSARFSKAWERIEQVTGNSVS